MQEITDKISVVVPCWNYGMFLRECLDSLLAQTVLPAKIIVSDDHSTDDSVAVAISAMDKIKPAHIVLTNSTRRGTIVNENEAAKHVDTPWMFFLDADDKVEPTYIEKILRVIETHDDKLAIVYSDMMKFGNWTGAWVVSDWDPVALRTGNYINGHSVFRTDLFRRVGGLKEGPGFEDHQLWVDMLDLDEGYYGKRVPETLVWYRRHDHGHRTDGSDITTRMNRT